MRTRANETMLRGLRRQIENERLDGLRPVWMRARRLEQGVDFSHLTIVSSNELINSSGLPVFVIGHSEVGGSDRVGA